MKQRILASTLVTCGIFCGGMAEAGSLQSQEEGNKSPAYTIVGARVFDGEHWLPPGTQVRVQHGLVLAVGPDVGLARGGTLIDATGKTLLPETAESDGGKGVADTLDHSQSGRGAIIAGAHADLRLVNGDSSQNWSGLGEIAARWKSGVLVGGSHRGGDKPL